MAKRIENFLKNLSIEELQQVRVIAANLIHDYHDGFIYECHVRSYGRNWTEKHNNPHTVQELCYQYGGDDGIVDIYTNNSSLSVENYGNTFYFPTMEDAERWRKHRFLTNSIPQWKEEWNHWENRDNLPFKYRPTFEPYMKPEEIASAEIELEQLTEKVIQPVHLRCSYEEEDMNETVE